jgi:predicted DNA-binding transcriptional regulator AlpA
MERLSPLWTVDDVALHLGVPIRTLYKWRRLNVGPRSFKVGRHIRYRAEDVSVWLDEHGQARGAAAGPVEVAS